MTQSENDLKQLKACRDTLSNVYKSQVQDEIMDNGNLTTINNAILSINTVIAWLEAQNKPKD